MKYLIKESQIDKVIFKYLDNQDFIKIERPDGIYFVNSEEDEYGQIVYIKNKSWCVIYINLIEEISNFFSMDISDSKKIIGRWVENALQMEVMNTFPLNQIGVLNVKRGNT
jgi:hypothetical protein